MKFVFTLLLFSIAVLQSHDCKNFHPLSVNVSESDFYIKQDFDVVKYTLDIELLEPATSFVSGKCEIDLNWIGKPDTSLFYFHLQDLSVDSVFYESVRVEAIYNELDESEYYYSVEAPEEFHELNDAVVTVYYSGNMTNEGGASPWGGVFYREEILFSIGVGFRNSYVSTTRHWMPCYDHPSDKAKFEAKFRVPEQLEVASVGLLIDTLSEAGTKVWHWSADKDVATYLLTFAVGDFEIIEYDADGTPVMIFTKAADLERTELVFELVPDMKAAFEERFGDYPHSKIGYVILPISGGMEHQSMISYSRSGLFSEGQRNLLAAHELAHAWFGNYISPKDFRDAWMNESFATLCESIWMEKLEGSKSSFWTEQRRKLGLYINNILPSEGKLPLYNFQEISNASNYPATIYYKGAVVLGVLRYLLGDDDFFALLYAYIEEFGNGNIETHQFKEFAEDFLEKDLDKFFEDYVFNSEIPQIEFSFYKDIYNRDYAVKLEQMQDYEFGEIPVFVQYSKTPGPEELAVYSHTLIDRNPHTIDYGQSHDVPIRIVNAGSEGVGFFQIAGINEIPTSVANSDLEISIFPQPTHDLLSVNLPNDILLPVSYSIVSSLGNVVYEGEANSNSFEIDLKSVLDGTYFLKIQSKQEVIVKKFIVLK